MPAPTGVVPSLRYVTIESDTPDATHPAGSVCASDMLNENAKARILIIETEITLFKGD